MRNSVLQPSRRDFLLGSAAATVFAAMPGTTKAQGRDKLVFGASSYPPNFTIGKMAGSSGANAKAQVFRGLVSYAPDGTLRGEIAESWTQPAPDTYIFKLRENVKFHDGTTCDAEAVRYNLEFSKDGSDPVFTSAICKQIETIRTPDPLMVEVKLAQPNATFLMFMAHLEAGFWSPKNREAGTGPYRVVATDRGAWIDYEAFDGFYRPGFPKTKKLRVTAYANEDARVAALDAGDVDIIELVPWSAMARIEGNSALSLLSVDRGGLLGVLFNASNGPFKDKRIRQAAAHAMSSKDVAQAVLFGRGTDLRSVPFSPDGKTFTPSFAEGWDYSPNKARKLLADAGVPDGFTCNLLSTAQYVMHKDTALVVQQSLAEVGITVNLNLVDWPTRVQLGNRGQYDLAITGAGAEFNDPDALSQFLESSQPPNYSRPWGYANPEVDRLFLTGRQETDNAKRIEIYQKLHDLLIEEAVFAGLVWREQGYGVTKAVSGFKPLPGLITWSSAAGLENISLSS
jgi:peptide/nickel transport system substrate-binding protein